MLKMNMKRLGMPVLLVVLIVAVIAVVLIVAAYKNQKKLRFHSISSIGCASNYQLHPLVQESPSRIFQKF